MNPVQTSPARYIHLLIAYLEGQGIDCTAVLARFDIDRHTLAHPETQLQPLRALELFRALASQRQASDIGLRVGKLLNFGALGDVGRAMLSCANVQQALQCCAEYFPLVAPSFAMRISESPTQLTLSWLPVRPVPYDFLGVSFDMAIGAMDSLLGTLLGDRLEGYDVYFTYPAPAHEPLYARLTRARCHFNVPGMLSLRMTLDKAMLQAPCLMHNPGELTELRKRLSLRLGQTPGQGSWTAWVRMMLEGAHGEQPSQASLATIVQISSSTLARYLAQEGTSFRKLANEVRHQRACRWLDEGQMRISDMADKLGYANLPSFVRAFKAQSGCSPTQYAKQPRTHKNA